MVPYPPMAAGTEQTFRIAHYDTLHKAQDERTLLHAEVAQPAAVDEEGRAVLPLLLHER